MSWSFTFESIGDADTFTNDVGTAYAAAILPAEQLDKGRDAIESAIAAAVLLVAGGVVGDSSRALRCTLSGHANRGHVPEAGWANDYVAVTINQL